MANLIDSEQDGKRERRLVPWQFSDDWASEAEVAEAENVSKTTIQARRRAGLGPAWVKLGKLYFYSRKAWREDLESRAVVPPRARRCK